MTEQQWLTCDNAALMFAWLTGEPMLGVAADVRALGHCPVTVGRQQWSMLREALASGRPFTDRGHGPRNWVMGWINGAHLWGNAAARARHDARTALLMREIIGNPFDPCKE